MFFGDAEVSKSHKNSNALGFRLKSVPLDIGCFFTAFQSLYQKNFQSLSDLFVVVNPFYTDLRIIKVYKKHRTQGMNKCCGHTSS